MCCLVFDYLPVPGRRFLNLVPRSFLTSKSETLWGRVVLYSKKLRANYLIVLAKIIIKRDSCVRKIPKREEIAILQTTYSHMYTINAHREYVEYFSQLDCRIFISIQNLSAFFAAVVWLVTQRSPSPLKPLVGEECVA